MKSIVQIELTNHCNRRCHYCGQVNMKREKGFMSFATLDRCVWVLGKLGQTKVGLHHFGESLMHPEFVDAIRLCNAAGVIPWFYTNGDFLSDDMIRKLTQVKLDNIVISGHMERCKRIERRNKCTEAGIPNVWWQQDMGDSVINMAGQLQIPNASDNGKKPLQDPMRHCRFLVDQMCCVLWNGDLVPCCIDYEGSGVFGNIHDEDVLEAYARVCPLCWKCPGHPGNVI
jgi:hypothetical protein